MGHSGMCGMRARVRVLELGRALRGQSAREGPLRVAPPLHGAFLLSVAIRVALLFCIYDSADYIHCKPITPRCRWVLPTKMTNNPFRGPQGRAIARSTGGFHA